MKIIAVFCLILASFAASGLAQFPAAGPVGPGSVKITNILPSAPTTPEYQITGGATKRYTLGKWLEVEVAFDTQPDLIDELTFHYVIMISGKLLDGDVTLVNIPKGRDHYSVMYVAPRTLQSLTGGQQLTSGDVQNVWVEISYQGEVINRKAVQARPIPGLPHLTGMVLNKNLTPFAPLYWDRYEAIKSETH